jgi:hypothetical protein
VNASRGAALLPALAAAAGLIACSPWISGPAPTPTFQIEGSGPRYLSAPPPVGYLLAEPAYEIASLYDSGGRLLEVLQGVTLREPGPTAGAAASPLLTPAGGAWFAFLQTGASGTSLQVREGPEVLRTIMLEAPVGLCGSIPAGFIGLSDVVSSAENESPEAVLYLLDAAGEAGSERPILRQPAPPSSRRPLPLAIVLQDGAPTHVYYTLTPQDGRSPGSGLGYGLFLLDTATGLTSTSLDDSNWVLGLSPDQTFVAFLAAGQSPPEVRIARLDGASTVLFQPLSGTRQALGAAFSPDSSRVAWATVSGDGPARAEWLLNLAPTFGGPTTQVALGSLIAADQGSISAVYPAAWISPSSILVQVERGDSRSVYRYETDSGEWELAGAGVFVALIYP